MRAQEFIVEAERLPKSHADATPDMRKHPGLDNSSPYAPWRFAAHFLAGADGEGVLMAIWEYLNWHKKQNNHEISR